jgi:hypothetical protein
MFGWAAADSGWSGRVFRAESVTFLPQRDGGRSAMQPWGEGPRTTTAERAFLEGKALRRRMA